MLTLSALLAVAEPSSAQAACTSTAIMPGPTGGHYYQGVCADLTWEEARARAEQRGGYLATATSAVENDFLFNLVSDESFWSVNAFNAAIGPFIGGYQTRPCASEPAGCWGWVTGEAFSFTAWGGGEPSNSGDTEHFLHLYGCCSGIGSRGSVWNDISNDILGESRGYIIEWTRDPTEQGHIYWTNYGSNGSGSTLGLASIDGSDVFQSFITGAAGPAGIHVTNSHIFWSDTDDTNCGGTTIGRADLDGNNFTPGFLTGVECAHGITSNGTHIFWANRGRGGAGSSIGRANIDGTGLVNNFITGAAGPHGITSNDTHIYWANYNNGTIGRANIDGSGVDQAFITGANQPSGVAVSGTHLYWSNNGGDTIGRARLDGTGIEQSFITGANFPAHVATNSTHLFWTNFGAPGAVGGGNSIGRAKLDGTDVDQNFVTGAESPSGIDVRGETLQPQICVTNPAAICASDQSDLVEGTRAADVIFTFGGNDDVYAGLSDDFVDGGGGNDAIYGDASGTSGRLLQEPAAGDDLLLGGGGNDQLFGEKGDDRLKGGKGKDILRGSSGFDILIGGPGRDTCIVTGNDRTRGCERERRHI